jgi:broad specificity phosphatase PhoE
MTTIYLVRLGESQANVERVFSNGRVDLPLTARGRRQAAHVAAWLAGRGVDHVYSSPLLRARQTAAQIGRRLGVGVTVLPDLDEVRVGDLDGRRDEASWALHDQIIARWRTGDRAAAFPGGESYGQAYDRFAAALQDIARRHSGGMVAVVTHGAIVGTVVPRLCPTLGDEITRGAVRWAQRNAAITALEASSDGFACTTWGYTGHLSDRISVRTPQVDSSYGRSRVQAF